MGNQSFKSPIVTTINKNQINQGKTYLTLFANKEVVWGMYLRQRKQHLQIVSDKCMKLGIKGLKKKRWAGVHNSSKKRLIFNRELLLIVVENPNFSGKMMSQTCAPPIRSWNLGVLDRTHRDWKRTKNCCFHRVPFEKERLFSSP